MFEPRRAFSTAATIACVGVLASCANTDDGNTAAPVSSGLPTSSLTVSEPLTVTMGESFHLSGNSYGQGPIAGMTFTITDVDTAPQCEAYDSESGDYLMKEQAFIAIEFDVTVDANSAPMSFGSPDWFRAKDPEGYVTDDLTISSGACDDTYPEFTNSDLMAGDKH